MQALLQALTMLGLPLFEQSADGVVRANDAARALTGAELPGTLAASIAKAVGCAEHDAQLRRVLACACAGQTASASLEGARLVALQDSVGGICAVVMMSPAELERRAALVDAAAEVTHEIGNALSAITGWAEIARTERQRERVDDALDRIEASATSARDAARGLLGAARTPGAAIEPGPNVADAAALALNVGRTLGPLAGSRGVRLDAVASGHAPVEDPSGKLWTILWNLTKNAIEAAPKGGLVEVRVAALPRGVRVLISDDGPGMDAAARERAFEPYFTTKRDGTGLGLPLVRRAVESLGGAITLEGRRGGGLRAVVTLPGPAPVKVAQRRPTQRGLSTQKPAQAVRSRPRAAQRDTGVRSRPALAEREVLVLEDDTALRELVATTLELRGARVTAVASAASAQALTGPFDLAIIDLTLGAARGDRVLHQLRARGILRGPAIIATGRALPASLEAEPDALLRKPFAIEEMTDLVAELTASLSASRTHRG